jgi:hypothetical protein
MKKPEEAIEILEAYDLTRSLLRKAVLAGCDHKAAVRGPRSPRPRTRRANTPPLGSPYGDVVGTPVAA